MRTVVRDFAIVAGTAMVAFGLWSIWPPVMFLAVGLLLIAVAVGGDKL